MLILGASNLGGNLGGWFHDLSPFLMRFTQSFGIRWYGVSYVLGFAVGYLLLRLLAKRHATKIPVVAVGDAIMLMVVGVMIGGRLGYVFLYKPSLLIDFSTSAPWWGVLAINNGGMSSHGGIIGVILACWWISRGFKAPDGSRIGRCSPIHVMDMAALIAPAGLMFGRLANFINGELLGKIVAAPGQPAPWYAVRYPQEIQAFIEEDPDTKMDVVLDALVQTPEQLDQIQRISAMHMLLNDVHWQTGFARVVDRIQHGDFGLKAQLEPLIAARYPTQLMQAGFDGVLVGLVVWIVAMKPRKPGVIGAWFLLVYGLGRIPMDLVRLPDTDVSQFGFLTRGQAYSAIMVIAGIVILVWTHRSKAEPTGGWRKNPAHD